MKHDNSIEKVTQPWLLFWYFWKHLTWYDTYAKFYIQALTCSGFMIGDSVPIPTPPPSPRPWRQTNIFQYSPSSRRMVPLLVNIDEPEKQKQEYPSLFIKCSCFKGYIALAKWHRVIAKWSNCKVTSFFLHFNSSLFVSCESSNNLVSLWLTYPGNKYNNN